MSEVGALPPEFVCSWTDGGGADALIRVAGELDVATVPQLEDTLREPRSQARLVVLDLRELVFMDSAGVHAIVNATVRARQVGRRLALVRGRPHVDRLFTLTGTRQDVEVGDIDAVALSVRRLL